MSRLRRASFMISAYKPAWQVTEAEIKSILTEEPQEFQSLIEPLQARDVAYASDLAHLKRFIERWRADRSFREALPADAVGSRPNMG